MEERIPEHFWTPQQIADRWRVSVDTIIRLFEHEPDVLILAQPAAKQKRRYRTIRIPNGVLVRVEKRRSLVTVDNTVYASRCS
jgi:hypothetical protein